MAKNGQRALRQGMLTGLGAFFLALVVNFGSQGLLSSLTSIILSFLLLLVIILVGIIFDVVGVATTAAKEAPFHARAARKQVGARQAIQLIRHADRVASFCNDVVGDVAGTLSGAVGAVMVTRLVAGGMPAPELWLSTVMIAGVAALTIGGKAFAKGFAIREAEAIVYRVGYVLALVEVHLGLRLWQDNHKRGRKT
ncbi:MAG: hypothetical protein D9V47_09820 [Clostridia bacterium]|nr:MAG: hypothetical protein D9V47_09820 [Clostridia bacterium]